MTNDHRAIVALADPTRRAIFEFVAARPRSVAELTRALPVTQSAVSQHLKILREVQLFRPEPMGARNIYYLDHVDLGQMRAWLDYTWAAALDEFKANRERGGMITEMIVPAPIHRSVTVEVSVERAFEVFTANFGRWWSTSHDSGGRITVSVRPSRPAVRRPAIRESRLRAAAL